VLEKINKTVLNKVFKITLLIIIFGFATLTRIQKFDQEGGDHQTYKEAVEEFVSGVNPYVYTIRSYEDRALKHGYATLPTLLYIYTFFYKVNQIFDLDIATKVLWKIPTLLADIGVGILFIKTLYKKNFVALLFCLLVWFFNPHILIRKEYTLWEPLPVFFLFLSACLLNKNDFASGAAYGLAISFKTFPIIFFPLFLLISKDKIKFLLGGGLIGLLISIPFMKSFEDFSTYINGSVFVHGQRKVQGRPLLTFISFYTQKYGINSNQPTYTAQYAYLALFVPWAISVIAFFKRKTQNIYSLSIPPIIIYIVLTPVFNRTHIVWFIPFLLLGVFYLFENLQHMFYIIGTICFILVSGYLYIWNRGFPIYNCYEMVSPTPTEKAASQQCDNFDAFGFSHCPKDLGYCLPHCCLHEKVNQ